MKEAFCSKYPFTKLSKNYLNEEEIFTIQILTPPHNQMEIFPNENKYIHTFTSCCKVSY